MVDPSQSVDCRYSFVANLIQIQIRNWKAIQEAQQKMLEGMGSFAKSQTEIVERTLSRSVSEPPNATSWNVRAVASHQSESLKTTLQENQANSNILIEIATRSSGEVATILQSRMMAALDEFKAALEHFIPEQMSAAAAVAPAATAL